MQRYRECHDLYHSILGLPTTLNYEIVVKFFEFANLGLPMAGLSSLFAPMMSIRLSAKRRERLWGEFVPWAMRCGSQSNSLIGVYWEEKWERDIEELRAELRITPPPLVPPKSWPKKYMNAQQAGEATPSSAPSLS